MQDAELDAFNNGLKAVTEAFYEQCGSMNVRGACGRRGSRAGEPRRRRPCLVRSTAQTALLPHLGPPRAAVPERHQSAAQPAQLVRHRLCRGHGNFVGVPRG